MKQIKALCFFYGLFHVHIVESFGIVDVISNIGKANSKGRSSEQNDVTTTTPKTSEITAKIEGYTVVPLNETDSGEDYQDFDDLEQSGNVDVSHSLQGTLKLLEGLLNFAAVMSQLSGNNPGKMDLFKREVPETETPVVVPTEGEKAAGDATFKGRRYYAPAQDRFQPDTASKKFKKIAALAAAAMGGGSEVTSADTSGSSQGNNIDLQYQPIDVYPPYNPLTANTAETYNKDDQKTSYDADSSSYKMSKNPMKDYMTQNGDSVDIQQSYSYEIPQDMTSNSNSMGGMSDSYASWQADDSYSSYKPKKNLYPVYMAPTEHTSYQSWDNSVDPHGSDDHDNHDHFQSHPMKNKYPSYGEDIMTSTDDENSEPEHKPWEHPEEDFPTPPPKKKMKLKKEPPPPQPPPTDDDDSSKEPKSNYPNVYSAYDPDFHSYPHPPPDYHDLPPEHHDEMMDEDRDSKRPYSYYFLGRKLWYVPLLFSVYFIIYIGALILKSLARHKIQFPEKLWDIHETHDHHDVHDHHRKHRKLDEVTESYETAVEKSKNKFL